MTVESEKKATLNYAVYFDIGGDGTEIAIDRNTKLANAKYNGRKYNKHFKFVFDLASVTDRYSDAYANLIISKEVTSSETDQYGAIVASFHAVLDVTYNDHHGDYIPLTCTTRYFNR